MITIENPAARLLLILQEARKNQPMQDKKCEDIWKRILNVENTNNLSNNSLLLFRLAKTIELPSQTEELLKTMDVSQGFRDANQVWINRVNQGFLNQQLNGKWISFIQYIDDNVINSLTLTTEHIQEKLKIKPDNLEKLSELKLTFQNLENEIITNQELENDIKSYLIRSLQRIILAIDEYFITGYIPIIDAIETTIGHVALDSKTSDKKVVTAFYETGIWKQIFSALNIISSMVTLATGVPVLSNELMSSLSFLSKD